MYIVKIYFYLGRVIFLFCGLTLKLITWLPRYWLDLPLPSKQALKRQFQENFIIRIYIFRIYLEFYYT
jgi:hypothetical protein